MAENLAQVVPHTQKSSSKFVTIMTLSGVIVGVALVSVYFPKMISWYFEPPMPMGVSCTSSISDAIHKFQLAQLGGVLGGALIGFLLGWRFRKRAA